jgi:RimJ/RimL family protein N-acetyltransferase
MTYINGKNISLRIASTKDTSILCKWWSDGRIMKHVGLKNGLKTDPDKLQARLSESNSNNSIFIVLNNSGQPIGECTFSILENGKCSIGIKIGELPYQGKGFGKDALLTFIDYLFTSYSIPQIILDTLIENVRAQSLYQSIGFKKKRINRNCWVDPEGIERSAVEMSLSKDKFYRLYKKK